MKRIGISLLVLFFIMACSSEPKIKMEDIHNTFAINGINLLDEEKKTKYFKLNGKKAKTYKLENEEKISFYIFNSEKNRKKGLKDFNKQKGKYDMQIPSIYEVENVLIHYWYNDETGSKTEYDEEIKEAVDSLRGINS